MSRGGNDCFTSTMSEIDSFFEGGKGYDGFLDEISSIGVITDEGVITTSKDVLNIFDKSFYSTEIQFSDISDIGKMSQVRDAHSILSLYMKHNSGKMHLDTIRSIKYYHTRGVVVQMRIGSYNISSFPGSPSWLRIVTGIKY